MAFAKWSRPIQDEAGNLIPNVYCEVRRAVQGTPKAVLYADREGTVTLDNPFLAADGEPEFFAIGAAYNVRVYATGYDETFEYEAVGTGAEVDANELLQPGYLLEFEIQTTAPPAAGALRANNVNFAAATLLFISKVNKAGSSIASRLAAMAPGGKSNKNVLAVTSADGLQVSWSVDAVTDHTDYVELTVSSHNGETALNAGAINLQLLVSGADGFVPGISLVFSTTTTAADPGAGKFRLNHATHASATAAYIDNVEALSGASITALLDSWDDAAAAIRGQLLIVSKIDPGVFRLYNVTGTVVDSTGYRTVTIAYVAGAGTMADLTACVVSFSRSGDDGFAPGYRLAFDTTVTDADPGAGKVRFNNATAGSISFVYIDNADAYGNSLITWEDGLDDVSNVNARAYLRFQKATDPGVYIEFAVTGAVTDGTGYRKIPVSFIAGAVPANGTVLVASATKSGADAVANTDELETTLAQVLLRLADIDNVAEIVGPAGNRVADSFDALTYVDVAGATNLDSGTAGVLKPSATAGSDQTQTHTSATQSGCTASASTTYSTNSPWKAVAKTTSTSDVNWWLTAAVTTGWWQYQFASAPTIGSYSIRAGGTYADRSPKDWTVLGSTTGAYAGEQVTLDTRTNQTGWNAAGEKRTFSLAAGVVNTYPYLRINVTANNGDAFLGIDEVEFLSAGTTNNLTVALGSFPALTAPGHMKAILVVKEVVAATAGTDYTLEVSRNNKTNWTTATLTELFTVGGLTYVQTNNIDVSGQPSGTTLWGRFKTDNGKMVELQGWYLYWGP